MWIAVGKWDLNWEIGNLIWEMRWDRDGVTDLKGITKTIGRKFLKLFSSIKKKKKKIKTKNFHNPVGGTCLQWVPSLCLFTKGSREGSFQYFTEVSKFKTSTS